MKWNKKAEEGPPGYATLLMIALIIATCVILFIILIKFTGFGNIAWNKIKHIIVPFD